MRLSQLFVSGSGRTFLSPTKSESHQTLKTEISCLTSTTDDTAESRSQSIDINEEDYRNVFLAPSLGSLDLETSNAKIQVDEKIICRQISIVGTTIDANGKPFTTYVLSVGSYEDESSTWKVYRRYSQFLRFRDRLSRIWMANVELPRLPPRIKLFEMRAVVQMRQDLEAWVKEIQTLIMVYHDSTETNKSPAVGQLDRAMISFLSFHCDKCPSLFKILWQVNNDTCFDDELSLSSRTNNKVGLHDFELVQVIGKGAFGKVSLVRKKSDQRLYAMKTIAKCELTDDKRIGSAVCERRVLENVTHPFITKMHYAFQTTDKLFFVLEYAAGGELFFHLSQRGSFPEKVARFFCAELVLALEYLHEKGIIYRDLKPENILLDAEGHVKLVDFGLAKVGVSSPFEGAQSFVGTYQYLAPEVICRQGHGFAVDWWALGMVTYEMLTGLPPWYTEDQPVLFDRICRAPLRFPRCVSRIAASFIAALLQRDPKIRLGNDVSLIKSHTFFYGLHWDELLAMEITPPLCPCPEERHAEAAANFADEFKSLPVDDYEQSDSLDGNDMGDVRGEPFQYFTYEGDSNMEMVREQLARVRLES